VSGFQSFTAKDIKANFKKTFELTSYTRYTLAVKREYDKIKKMKIEYI